MGFDLELTAAQFIAPPSLSLRSHGGQLAISWPAWCARATVEGSSSLGLSAVWTSLTNGVVISAKERTESVGPPANGERFFRLRLQ